MLKPAHLSRFDLNLLVLFHVVYEEQPVARAAERLSLTPSAVSHGLGRLRRLLNDPLFLRTPQRRGAVCSGGRARRTHCRDHHQGRGGDRQRRARRCRAGRGGGSRSVRRMQSQLFWRRICSMCWNSAPGIDIGLVQLLPEHRGNPQIAELDDVLVAFQGMWVVLERPFDRRPTRPVSSLLSSARPYSAR